MNKGILHLEKRVGKVILCTSLWSKAKGLMLSQKKKKALVFVFADERMVSIHMIGVFYPIDVYFLDTQKQVIKAAYGLLPFIGWCSHKAQFVVEAPEGILKLKMGDQVEWNQKKSL